MNIYLIDVWGPSQEEEVEAHRSDMPDSTAVVFAPTKNIANQVCYLAATRDAQGQSTYHEIRCFSQAVSCVLGAGREPIVFGDTIVKGLLGDPILPELDSPDIQTVPGSLFCAHCVDETGATRGDLWVYSADGLSANVVATEYADAMDLFDLDTEAIRVDLHPVAQTCVFWDVRSDEVTELRFS